MSKDNRTRDNFSNGFIETEMKDGTEIKRIYVYSGDKCVFKVKFAIPHHSKDTQAIVVAALDMLGEYDSTKVYPKKPVW